ncbi:hypothetical protein [Nocardia sp. CA-290969]|uniref:hypothetical protein n=1 Tax=Nocardia sp. CA-290969 TaxID=3239986 RepID=UPI003D91981C
MGNVTAEPQRFQKLPVTIEALQWDGTADGATAIIDWIVSNGGTATFRCAINGPCPGTASGSHVLSIRTLEGTMRARPSDWIIRGVEGEFYPCTNDVHRKTYRPAPAPEDIPEVLNLTAEQEAAIRRVGDPERMWREAWIAGYRLAENMWALQHRCCSPLTGAELDEEYTEWRSNATAGQEKSK